MRLLIGLILLNVFTIEAIGQTKVVRKKGAKSQEVNFDEMSLQGQVRNPQGSYLIQKNGIQFMPLYDIQKDVDERIRKSQEWLR